MNQEEGRLERRNKKVNRGYKYKRLLQWGRYLAWIILIVVAIAQYQEWQEVNEKRIQLEQQLEQLKQENQRLEEERERLKDPKELENVAREELGLVKPGEVPYVK